MHANLSQVRKLRSFMENSLGPHQKHVVSDIFPCPWKNFVQLGLIDFKKQIYNDSCRGMLQ